MLSAASPITGYDRGHPSFVEAWWRVSLLRASRKQHRPHYARIYLACGLGMASCHGWLQIGWQARCSDQRNGWMGEEGYSTHWRVPRLRSFQVHDRNLPESVRSTKTRYVVPVEGSV